MILLRQEASLIIDSIIRYYHYFYYNINWKVSGTIFFNNLFGILYLKNC